MDELTLLIDLYKHAYRQGPGGDSETKLALGFCGLDPSKPLKVADIGCGTGASTLVLAKELNAAITAVDFLDEFLEILNKRAIHAGVSEKIETLSCSMDSLPFEDEEFDILWSEAAIYNIGFENGIQSWNRYLKPGGFLVVSEISWLTETRPSELQKYWDSEYPEIDTASSKISLLEKSGYSPVSYFVLPEHCWMENYYNPLQKSFKAFLQRNNNSEEAQAVVDAGIVEMELYKNYRKYFGYGFYIARKTG
ncbi:class I SAM-dependent methyltransferase [Rhodohalobacter mucosus]|uniref:SAM-dependent methyltransferase n=1 Tax=Rhodohalobacter mucosus TaxID=2079485 RepID=A0A316TUH8_9BACT|nr:class I SAM-dependent methyltransferase [Rhodohalobacter mucosus]PWN06004.1 SAM-dependent methyltransferase [Rhodohalobacter mucosus]